MGKSFKIKKKKKSWKDLNREEKWKTRSRFNEQGKRKPGIFADESKAFENNELKYMNNNWMNGELLNWIGVKPKCESGAHAEIECR